MRKHEALVAQHRLSLQDRLLKVQTYRTNPQQDVLHSQSARDLLRALLYRLDVAFDNRLCSAGLYQVSVHIFEVQVWATCFTAPSPFALKYLFYQI